MPISDGPAWLTAAAFTCVLLLLGAVAFVAPLSAAAAAFVAVIQSHSLSQLWTPARLTLAGGFSSTTITHRSVRPSRQTVQPSRRGNTGLTQARTEPRTDRSAPRCYHFRGCHRASSNYSGFTLVRESEWKNCHTPAVHVPVRSGNSRIIIIIIFGRILCKSMIFGGLCAAEMHTNDETMDWVIYLVNWWIIVIIQSKGLCEE